MYKYGDNQIMMPLDFFLPFDGKLNPENRWCKLAELVPWNEAENKYAVNFKTGRAGRSAYSIRVALGALLIQARKGLSDRDTVEEITENPYLQYFIGLSAFIDKAPFDASMMVHFRKRIGIEEVSRINLELSRALKGKAMV